MVLALGWFLGAKRAKSLLAPRTRLSIRPSFSGRTEDDEGSRLSSRAGLHAAHTIGERAGE